MSHDHVQGLHRLEGHAGQPSGQSLVQILQADAGDALDGDLEAAVFAFAWDGHLQLHLREGEEQRGKSSKSPDKGDHLLNHFTFH